jgi:hypothetical protein
LALDAKKKWHRVASLHRVSRRSLHRIAELFRAFEAHFAEVLTAVLVCVWLALLGFVLLH